MPSRRVGFSANACLLLISFLNSSLALACLSEQILSVAPLHVSAADGGSAVWDAPLKDEMATHAESVWPILERNIWGSRTQCGTF